MVLGPLLDPLGSRPAPVGLLPSEQPPLLGGGLLRLPDLDGLHLLLSLRAGDVLEVLVLEHVHRLPAPYGCGLGHGELVLHLLLDLLDADQVGLDGVTN